MRIPAHGQCPCPPINYSASLGLRFCSYKTGIVTLTSREIMYTMNLAQSLAHCMGKTGFVVDGAIVVII